MKKLSAIIRDIIKPIIMHQNDILYAYPYKVILNNNINFFFGYLHAELLQVY